MAENQHGGYRQPSNPAPVSAPGAKSRRTDGQVMSKMSGMAYGENADFNDMQSSAPMSATNPQGPRLNNRSAPPEGMGGGSSSTPLFSETQRPDEPVTAGAPFGPGAGATGDPMKSNNSDIEILRKHLPTLIRMSEGDESPEGFNRFVRHVRNLA